jgi:RNA polymerase sigma-70 factor (ECF subfamily)
LKPPVETDASPATAPAAGTGAAWRAIDHAFRREYGRLVAILTRQLGPARLNLVEDVVQDALLRAARTWPYRGVPPQPTAWLITTARNRAHDLCRRDQNWQRNEASLIAHLESLDNRASVTDHAVFDEEIRDATLRMMFVCCDPGLPPASQIALILKTLAGFGENEIAAAFLLPRATIAKRLVRARRHLREHIPSFDLPPADQMAARTQSVQHALYLLFNEGYRSSTGDQVIRADLCAEARRLLAELQRAPGSDTPATAALAALMCFHAARLDARVDLDGHPLLLAEQDRTTWNATLITNGLRHLRASGTGDQLTRYHCEAGIAACHCLAPDYARTDWPRIISLYQKLQAIAPSPLITLNHAIALIEHGDHPAAEKLMTEHLDPAAMENDHHYHAVQGHLLQDRDPIAARVALQRALELATLPSERRILTARLARLDSHA